MVLGALQWLVANNVYYRNVHIDPDVVAELPENGDLSGLYTVILNTQTCQRATKSSISTYTIILQLDQARPTMHCFLLVYNYFIPSS